MKNFLLIICLLVFPSFIAADEVCCDYIAKGYYQLIHEADMDYMSGNKEEAYRKITEARNSCNLLNQPQYREMSQYAELLSERNEFEEAIHYITILVKEYGYSSDFFEQQDYFQHLSSNIDWNIIKTELDRLNELFYTEERVQLAEELKEMFNKDQAIRQMAEDSIMSENFWQTWLRIDSTNEQRIKEIIEQYGYPNERLIGFKNFMLASSITTMIMHFEDTAYFKPVLLQFIKQGKCEPRTLGSFVDSRQRMDTRTDKYIYRIYDNAEDHEIWDIANLDNRRQAIGLPSMEMKHKRDSLLSIFYNIEVSSIRLGE